jgi:hypothetical protein
VQQVPGEALEHSESYGWIPKLSRIVVAFIAFETNTEAGTYGGEDQQAFSFLGCRTMIQKHRAGWRQLRDKSVYMYHSLVAIRIVVVVSAICDGPLVQIVDSGILPELCKPGKQWVSSKRQRVSEAFLQKSASERTR